MTQKTFRAKRPLLVVLIILLTAVLCASLALLWNVQTRQGITLTAEAGTPLPAAGEFLPGKENVSYWGNLSAVSMDKPGQYPVTLTWGFLKYEALLKVVDTVPPAATVSDLTVYSPATAAPEDFISDIDDATDVTVRFEKTPDTSASGEQTVTLVLTDLGGNETRLETLLTVVVDTQAPQIHGVADIVTYVGDAVAYRNGVTVSDDQDESVKLELDSAGVDLSTAGVYTVTYRACDASGNAAKVQATVTVLEKQQNHVALDVIYQAVDAALAKFITDDMTDREKAEAVYVWTRLHFTYGGHTDTTDYIQSAYQFLTSRKGDCYGFFALQKLMLQRMNIPTMDVTKVKNFPGDSNHYWLLVSIDGGQNYYHYDNVWSKQLCLVTDKRLNAFSKQVNNCFNRDESLYPPTPEEALPASTLPWSDPKIVDAIP